MVAASIRMGDVLPHSGMLANHPSVASREMLPKLYPPPGCFEGDLVALPPRSFVFPLSAGWCCQLENSSSGTSALTKTDPLVWRGIISSTGEAEAGSAGEQPAKE
jgi:hypothetical protein